MFLFYSYAQSVCVFVCSAYGHYRDTQEVCGARSLMDKLLSVVQPTEHSEYVHVLHTLFDVTPSV